MAQPDPDPRAPQEEITVLYDGACPLCRREIGVYQRGAQDAPLRFCDISRADVPATELPAGMTREQLLARFHVRRADGVVFSGAEAFVKLWATLPGWRWLARLVRLPGMLWLMERSYRGFLRVRPAVQRLVVRLERRQDRG
ncbi:thiol-disulfide oxidoreductase DCC family protein [Herbaspirillum huttiense]|uniref:thiol-disulfide oxidoreductase DCC family protein n=1 Tax=Herbaspirillum huttiense TaxID=863372 RepID=UPI0039B011CA